MRGLTGVEVLDVGLTGVPLVVGAGGLQNNVELAQLGEAVEQAEQLVGAHLPAVADVDFVGTAVMGATKVAPRLGAKLVVVTILDRDFLNPFDLLGQTIVVKDASAWVQDLVVRVEVARDVCPGLRDRKENKVLPAVDAVVQASKRQANVVLLCGKTHRSVSPAVDGSKVLKTAIARRIAILGNRSKLEVPVFHKQAQELALDPNNVDVGLVNRLGEDLTLDLSRQVSELREAVQLPLFSWGFSKLLLALKGSRLLGHGHLTGYF